MSRKVIKVLSVDDSALVRQALASILTPEEGFEFSTAPNPVFAQSKIQKNKPDVIILDVEMPEMDGLTYLSKIMSENPIAVLICSGVTAQGSVNAIRALELGAVDIIEKPKMGTRQFIEESKTRIIDAVRAAASVDVKGLKKITVSPSAPVVAKKTVPPFHPIEVSPKLTADAVLELPKTIITAETEKIVVVGASTGGTEALKDFLLEIPADCPPILIVQHMPIHFTKAFAQRLNSICPPEISEAVNDTPVLRGNVYIAQGDSHLLLNRKNGKYYIEVREGPLVTRHRPSVDVLFRSAARYAGKNCIGVIMTGMGDDGARGMLEMKETGAITIAQDEKSCVVYGMPKEAVKRNAVDFILPLNQIAKKVMELAK